MEQVPHAPPVQGQGQDDGLANQAPADIEDEARPEVWSSYKCNSITFGKEHPGFLVEASVLASTPLPPAQYPIQDSLSQQIEDGTLSKMQLEGVSQPVTHDGELEILT